ncbi:HI1506-related protein [Chelativorans alearense]|uniref:HI1506-related protein n=1 Tax=Chelativorans alearense TaxID=2681495 RepID=UPI0013D1223E|nr:HI1506-related protein [Chelativorans alearense]
MAKRASKAKTAGAARPAAAPQTDSIEKEGPGAARKAPSTDSGAASLERSRVGVHPAAPQVEGTGANLEGKNAGPEPDGDEAGPTTDTDGGGLVLPEAMTREEFFERYPRLAAALEAWGRAEKPEALNPTIRIAARRDGFRRCGMRHPKAATDHPAGRFTVDELERLLAEPKLKVELV